MRQGSQLLTEIDLLCLSQNTVIVGEAKKRPVLTRRELNRKVTGLTQAAKLLRADSIVLAAGEPGAWEPAVTQRVRDAVHGEHWPTGQVPTVRTLCNLWGKEVEDQIL